MRIAPLTLLCALFADSPAAQAAEAPARLPAPVATELKAITDQCSEAGGKPMAQDAVKRVDLNGDGSQDYVLDMGSVGCEGFASIYGDREKGVTIFVGDNKGGATNAFSAWVFGARIDGEGAAAKLWLTVSGEACGRKPARDFATESFCDRAVTWNPKTRKFAFAPVATVRMIQ